MNITGGKYNSLKVKAPKNGEVRPTLSKIRAGVFNSLNSIINFETSSFLDCFGGSGIMSLEAISRGFKETVIIEKDSKTAQIIKENFTTTGLEPKLFVNDSLKIMQNIDRDFDVIYIDPPYSKIILYEKSLEIINKKKLLKKGGIIVLELKKNGESFVIPENFKVFKEKNYGETSILYLKYID